MVDQLLMNYMIKAAFLAVLEKHKATSGGVGNPGVGMHESFSMDCMASFCT